MKFNNIHPTGNHVVVRREEPEKRVGNILLPDEAQEESRIAVVVAVGPGKLKSDADEERIPIDLGVGDRVLLANYGGHCQIDYKDKPHIIIDADAILGQVL